jgi:para-nitrobenzyl esterase
MIAERKAALNTAPVYMYLVTWESDFLGGLFKSGHGIEIPLVFDIPDDVPLCGSAPGTHEMAAAMSEAWIAFARSGDPNHPGIPEWPSYSAANRATMLFDMPSQVVVDPFREELDAWEGMGVSR